MSYKFNGEIMKHKYCDVIKAWAEGATIQYSTNDGVHWVTCTGRIPAWEDSLMYRVKPVEYPKSTLDYEQLCAIVNEVAVERSNEGSGTRIAREAANQAVAHFITSGEMQKYFFEEANGFITYGNK